MLAGWLTVWLGRANTLQGSNTYDFLEISYFPDAVNRTFSASGYWVRHPDADTDIGTDKGKTDKHGNDPKQPSSHPIAQPVNKSVSGSELLHLYLYLGC